MLESEKYVIAFRDGASAMQGRIAAFLMMRGRTDLAPQVLALPLPEARPPERETVGGPDVSPISGPEGGQAKC